MRINTDIIDGEQMGWTEAEAWDEYLQYYQGVAAVQEIPSVRPREEAGGRTMRRSHT